MRTQPHRRLSRPLLPGMTVGLVAPGSPMFEPERRNAAVALLEEMGFPVKRGRTVDAADFRFAGDGRFRADDLASLFLDDAIDAVVCLRGGYGSARLLPLLPYQEIARHPKPFVGFSDITALHAAFQKQCGFVTFHGPMPGTAEAIGLREPRARSQWLATLAGSPDPIIRNPDGTPFRGHGSQTVVGRLIGGNLSSLTDLIGTPWEPVWDDKLLLLEDVGERMDRLEAMFAQMADCGVFERIGGLLLGDFSRYAGMTSPHELPLARVVQAHLPPELPILWGLHAGHDHDRMTLALNATYRLNPAAATLTLTEAIFTTNAKEDSLCNAC